MRFHVQLPELFDKERIKTENLAWQTLAANPPQASRDYLALPWSVVINFNHFERLPRLSLENGITTCQHILFPYIVPYLKKMGVTTLFTPHAETREINGIRILPFPHTPVNAGAYREEKDLWYSFAGFASHPCRRTILRLPPRKDVIIKRREKWHFYLKGHAYEAGVRDYRELLSRSRYSLCPRGTGPSTIRFWESLGAGAIPVLISDAMQLPPYAWDQCIIRIPERQAGAVNEVLSQISPQQELKMRRKCREAFERFSGPNLSSPIRDYLSE